MYIYIYIYIICVSACVCVFVCVYLVTYLANINKNAGNSQQKVRVKGQNKSLSCAYVLEVKFLKY